MAPRQIAARLNREAVPSPRGGQWNASTINGNRRRRNGILNNELYTGRITYNRQRFVKDPETGRRLARPNPEHEWVTKRSLHSASLKTNYGSGSKRSSNGTRRDGAISGRARNAFFGSPQVRALRRWHDDQQEAIATTVRHDVRRALAMPTAGLVPTNWRTAC